MEERPDWLTFELISKNVMVDATDISPDGAHNHSCHCPSGSTCTSNACDNYATLIECTNCSPHCKNNRIQRRRYADIFVQETILKGHGLFCNEDLETGQFITEYVGELCSKKEFMKRCARFDYIYFLITLSTKT